MPNRKTSTRNDVKTLEESQDQRNDNQPSSEAADTEQKGKGPPSLSPQRFRTKRKRSENTKSPGRENIQKRNMASTYRGGLVGILSRSRTRMGKGEDMEKKREWGTYVKHKTQNNRTLGIRNLRKKSSKPQKP